MSVLLPGPLAAVIPGGAEALWPDLASRYTEAGRHYHDVAHIHALSRHFAQVDSGPGWQAPAEIALAILFHDAIYVCGRGDNEARSASLARAAIAAHLASADIDVDRVVLLIHLTADHGRLKPGSLSADPDAQHFLDADMAILGSPPTRYAEYEAQIRREYHALPDEVFAEGRGRFLERLLASDRIYLSAFFGERYEAQARANLRGALTNLRR